MSAASASASGSGDEVVKERMPVDNPEPENQAKEEERTLTDHLNKKLLESFLARMDAGTTGFPNLPQPETQENGENIGQDFD